jgi:hypothetical protein
MILTLLVLTVSHQAHAMLLPNYGVDSLAFQASAVLLVERLGERKVGLDTTLSKFL